MQLPSIFVERPLVGFLVAATVGIVAGSFVAMWYWADCEASARGDRVSAPWTFAYLLSGIGQVHYAYVRYVRGDMGDRAAPPSSRERLATAYTLAVVAAYVVGAVVSPPDPFTQVRWFLPLFAVAFAVLYLLISHNGRDRFRDGPTQEFDG